PRRGNLDPRLQARLARRPAPGSGHHLDQHLQALLHLHAVLRSQAKRHRRREGTPRHPAVSAAEEPVLGPQRQAVAMGRLTNSGSEPEYEFAYAKTSSGSDPELGLRSLYE